MKYPEEFGTYDELRDYIINNIKQVGLCRSVKKSHPDIYKFFVSLFQRHPERERKGVALIDDISIRRYPISNFTPLPISDHWFFIIKNNGEEESISWEICITGEKCPVERRLTTAMRYEIDDDIGYFKFKNCEKPCELCGSSLNLTCDHIIKFKKLKDDFLILNSNRIPTEFSKNDLSQDIFREEDRGFAEDWWWYHHRNATLRILCKSCNQKLDNYKDNI